MAHHGIEGGGVQKREIAWYVVDIQIQDEHNQRL
jgi:hypothetical protein